MATGELSSLIEGGVSAGTCDLPSRILGSDDDEEESTQPGGGCGLRVEWVWFYRGVRVGLDD